MNDIDIVIIPVKTFLNMPQEAQRLCDEINVHGKKSSIVWPSSEGPIQVDFFIANEEDWGAQILCFSGCAKNNIYMRWYAKRKGMKLNQYGLFSRDTGERLGGSTEEEIYDLLRLEYKEPSERNKN